MILSIKTWAPHGPFLLARRLGLLDGLDIELHLSEDEAEKESLYVEGELDLLGTTLDYVPFVADMVPETRFFLKLGESAGADALVAAPEIKSATDLQGKIVALEPPGVSQLLLKEYMERNGLRYQDAVVKEVPHNETPAWLSSQKAAAVVTWEPYVQEALNTTPGAHTLITSADTPGLIVEGLMTRKEILLSHSTILAALVSAYFQAIDYLRKNEDEAKKIIAEEFAISEEELQQMLDTVILSGRQENVEAFSGTLEDTYGRLSRLWFDEGMTSEDRSGIVSRTVVDDALNH